MEATEEKPEGVRSRRGKKKEKEAKYSVLTRPSPLVTQEETEMRDGSHSSDGYKDQSYYQEEDEAMITPSPVTKTTDCHT